MTDATFWIIVVFAYYILATLLPVDKIIGKIYPLFAIALLFRAPPRQKYFPTQSINKKNYRISLPLLPAGLLAKLTPESLDATFWIIVVFAY